MFASLLVIRYCFERVDLRLLKEKVTSHSLIVSTLQSA